MKTIIKLLTLGLLIILLQSCGNRITKKQYNSLISENNSLKTQIEEINNAKIERTNNTNIQRRPSAIFSLNNSNIIYRGIQNPLTISFPGAKDLMVEGPGVSKVRGNNYAITPRFGKSLTVKVIGRTNDGVPVSYQKKFIIKNIHSAITMIRGRYGNISLPKKNIQEMAIGAGLPDLGCDIKITVSSFKISVPGKPAIMVSGNRMNSKAKKAISGCKIKEIIHIFDVKVKLTDYPSTKIDKALGISIKVND